MRAELGGSLTGGSTITSAVSEMKRINKQLDEVRHKFSEEEKTQTYEITAFYDKKIARLADTSPWDKEFETRDDYNSRLKEAEQKAAPARREKERKLASLRDDISNARKMPLEKQIKTLKDKRFTLPASDVSFRFTSYKLDRELMFGELTLKKKKIKFYAPIPKKNARQYKKNPDLLVPEVIMRGTLKGSKLDRIVFHGPGTGEEYIAKQGADVSDDGRFVDNGDGTVTDTKTELMWAVEDNGSDINWKNAKSYCENYTGGGYTDWRMPTQDELAGVYDKNKKNRHGYRVTRLIRISNCCLWVSETSGRKAAYFYFSFGCGHCYTESASHDRRALPVRVGN